MGVYVAKWILQQPEIQTRYETWLRDKGNWGDVGASLKKWYEFCDNHDIAYDRQGS